MLDTKVLDKAPRRGKKAARVSNTTHEKQREKSFRESDHGGEGEGRVCQTTTADCALGTEDSVLVKYARWNATKPSTTIPWEHLRAELEIAVRGYWKASSLLT